MCVNLNRMLTYLDFLTGCKYRVSQKKMPLGKWTKERGCEARKGQAIEFDQCAVKVDDQLDIVAPYRICTCVK